MTVTPVHLERFVRTTLHAAVVFAVRGVTELNRGSIRHSVACGVMAVLVVANALIAKGQVLTGRFVFSGLVASVLGLVGWMVGPTPIELGLGRGLADRPPKASLQSGVE